MSSLTYSERFLTWMTIEQGRSPRTIEAYRRDLLRYETFLASSSSDVLSAQSPDIEQFIASLRTEGKAAKSVARMYAAVRMLHRYLVEERLRPDNPTSGVDGVKVPNGIPKALSEDDVSRIWLLQPVWIHSRFATGRSSNSCTRLGREFPKHADCRFPI